MYKLIGIDQKQYGPVSAEQVRRWIAEGRANAQTRAQAEGASDWKPLGSFPEFAAALAPRSAPTPPPFPASPPAAVGAAAGNGLAVTGFVLSLIGLFCCFGPVFSALGLAFSCAALAQTSGDPHHRNRGLAIAGIVLSLFKLLILLGFLAFWPFRRIFPGRFYI